MTTDIPALGFVLNRAECTFDQTGIYAGADIVALRPDTLSQHDWNVMCRYLCGSTKPSRKGPQIQMPVDLDDELYERLALITDPPKGEESPKKDPPMEEIMRRRNQESGVKIPAPKVSRDRKKG
jgi:hypothetical protein